MFLKQKSVQILFCSGVNVSLVVVTEQRRHCADDEVNKRKVLSQCFS